MTPGCAPLGAVPGTAYQLTPHACRHCGGRVLRADRGAPPDPAPAFRCSVCGATAAGAPDGICGCGMLTGPRAGSALFRCGPNPTKSDRSPSEIVILFGDKQVAA